MKLKTDNLSQDPLITVLITVYNERFNLPLVCRELHDIQHALPAHEIIIVDDGSSDDTVAYLEQVRRSYLPQLRVISHDKCCGKSCALRTGARYGRGQWVATLDGDGQDKARDLVRLIDTALEFPQQKQILVGVRGRRQDGVFRVGATLFANTLRRILLRDGCPDTGAPLKVFPRKVFLDLPFFEGQHRFLPALLQGYGCHLRCLEVDHRQRYHGVSRYTNMQRALVGWLDLLGVIWLLRRTKLPSKVKEWR